MNVNGVGRPIFQVIDLTKKKKSKGMKEGISPYECEYCLKRINPKNKARHQKICYVKKNGKSPNATIYYAHRKKPYLTTYTEEITIDEDKEKIVPFVDKKIILKNGKIIEERLIVYCPAASGSGKSRWSAMYSEQYHQKYPKREIFLFSRLGQDEAFDKLKYVKRVKLEKMIDNQIEIEDLKDTLCIFDDVEAIESKILLERMLNLMHRVLTMGRHTGTSVIFCKHIACDRKATADILNEAHIICVFPHAGSKGPLNYLLDNHLGLTKEQKEKVRNVDSDWVAISRSTPPIAFHETGSFALL
jgi:hypothetical protein